VKHVPYLFFSHATHKDYHGAGDTADRIDYARRAEKAATSADPRIKNSEGGSFDAATGRKVFANSHGFVGEYKRSYCSVSAVPIAEDENGNMQRDYWFAVSRTLSKLESPEEVGRIAAERTLRRIGARKVKTQKVPIVFDPRVSRSLVGHLIGAIVGPAIARGTSFLKDKLGERIFPQAITIIDDPHRRRGLRSKPFDGEGIANRRRAIIENGVLTTWLLDLRSARQLGLKTTGHASRGTSSPPSPSPTNLWLEPGAVTQQALIGDIAKGFYVNELMGMGVNGVTGDYSRGAAGFWIENGELAYPVSEVTIAGNLKEMYQHLTAADDLEFKTGNDAPTLRVDGMMLAGS